MEKMLSSPDLYLGTFLIISGFALSLLNIRRIGRKRTSYARVLLSENIVLSCIGLAYVSRSIFEVTPNNMEMRDINVMSKSIIDTSANKNQECDFKAMLVSYGPLVVSLVNSFMSLIIDNYMHYQLLEKMEEVDDQNEVREVNQQSFIVRKIEVRTVYEFVKKYFSHFAMILHWILPFLMVLAMYPMEVKEKLLPLSQLRNTDSTCMAMLNMNNATCAFDNSQTNFTLEVRKHITTPNNYLEAYENIISNNTSQIESIVKNVYKIVANLNNNTAMIMNVTSPYLWRKSKTNEMCMKMCFIDNKKLLIYMFILAIVSYFIPITISVVILTKIHVMKIQRPNLKTFVNRELLYSILFWTPVMFDTFVSLLLCTYSMNGVRTSLFNVVANVYQAIKNYMNTKYFKENSVLPV